MALLAETDLTALACYDLLQTLNLSLLYMPLLLKLMTSVLKICILLAALSLILVFKHLFELVSISHELALSLELIDKLALVFVTLELSVLRAFPQSSMLLA